MGEKKYLQRQRRDLARAHLQNIDVEVNQTNDRYYRDSVSMINFCVPAWFK